MQASAAVRSGTRDWDELCSAGAGADRSKQKAELLMPAPIYYRVCIRFQLPPVPWLELCSLFLFSSLTPLLYVSLLPSIDRLCLPYRYPLSLPFQSFSWSQKACLSLEPRSSSYRTSSCLAVLASWLLGVTIYHQPVITRSELVGSLRLHRAHIYPYTRMAYQEPQTQYAQGQNVHSQQWNQSLFDCSPCDSCLLGTFLPCVRT